MTRQCITLRRIQTTIHTRPTDQNVSTLTNSLSMSGKMGWSFLSVRQRYEYLLKLETMECLWWVEVIGQSDLGTSRPSDGIPENAYARVRSWRIQMQSQYSAE